MGKRAICGRATFYRHIDRYNFLGYLQNFLTTMFQERRKVMKKAYWLLACSVFIDLCPTKLNSCRTDNLVDKNVKSKYITIARALLIKPQRDYRLAISWCNDTFESSTDVTLARLDTRPGGSTCTSRSNI